MTKIKVLVAGFVLVAAGLFGAMSVAAPAHAATLGGVDVVGWCKSTFNVPALGGAKVTNRNSAYSWRCTYAGVIQAWGVDMNRACVRQYGRGAWARPLRSTDPYSWRCYR